MQVSFVIAGVQKGGTTSMDAWLRQHPGICMAAEKEVHWFDGDRRFEEGRALPRRYHKAFRAAGPAQILGECTPSYIWWPPAMERICDYNPAMRVIVLLRCPLQRAWSHYRMAVSRGLEAKPFAEALAEEPRRLATEERGTRRFAYVSRGLYAGQVRRALSLFPRGQLLFLRSEAFRATPQAVMEEVCGFLGVAPHRFDLTAEHHVGADPGPMPEEARAMLRARLAPDVAELEGLLGWDLSGWLR